jgi:hypothetical protein
VDRADCRRPPARRQAVRTTAPGGRRNLPEDAHPDPAKPRTRWARPAPRHREFTGLGRVRAHAARAEPGARRRIAQPMGSIRDARDRARAITRGNRPQGIAIQPTQRRPERLSGRSRSAGHGLVTRRRAGRVGLLEGLSAGHGLSARPFGSEGLVAERGVDVGDRPERLRAFGRLLRDGDLSVRHSSARCSRIRRAPSSMRRSRRRS